VVDRRNRRNCHETAADTPFRFRGVAHEVTTTIDPSAISKKCDSPSHLFLRRGLGYFGE
jgi:hypothetical protein